MRVKVGGGHRGGDRRFGGRLEPQTSEAGAWEHLGLGAHAIMDAFSPWHAGFKEWRGGAIQTLTHGGSEGTLSNFSGKAHKAARAAVSDYVDHFEAGNANYSAPSASGGK